MDPDVPGIPWHYEIANQRRLPDGSISLPEGNFTLRAWMVDVPSFFAHGSGAYRLSAADRTRIESSLVKRPRRSDDYLGLLASINRRVAKIKGSGVSKWCQTCFMKPSGFFGTSQDHREEKPSVDNERRPVPFLEFGIDATEIVMVLARQLRLMTEGRAEEVNFKDRTSAASRRSIRQRP
jgi:hypothetical protein